MTDTTKYMSWFWQQLRAETYVVRCIHAHSGKCTLSQSYTVPQFMRSQDFLKARNAGDNHVYGRPESTKYILIDDLREEALQWLIGDGLTPVLWVATSKGKFHAWIKVSNEELPITLATATARLLALRYHGDECSADALHLGRIPGFINRKPQYRNERGRCWYVWASRPSHGVAPEAPKLLEEAMQRTTRSLSVSPSGRVLPASGNTNLSSGMTPEKAITTHRAAASLLADRFQWTDQQHSDRSFVDYHVATRLLLDGLREDDVIVVILHGSEKGRKRGFDYAALTVRKAQAMLAA